MNYGQDALFMNFLNTSFIKKKNVCGLPEENPFLGFIFMNIP